MRIRSMFLVLLAFFMAVPMQFASAQGLRCPQFKVCLFKTAEVGYKPEIVSPGFKLYAVDTATGGELWSAKIPGRTSRWYFLKNQRSQFEFVGSDLPATSQNRVHVRKNQVVAEAPATKSVIAEVPRQVVIRDRFVLGPTEYIPGPVVRVEVERERGWFSRNWWIPVLGTAIAGGVAAAVLGRSKSTSTATACVSINSSPCL